VAYSLNENKCKGFIPGDNVTKTLIHRNSLLSVASPFDQIPVEGCTPEVIKQQIDIFRKLMKGDKSDFTLHGVQPIKKTKGGRKRSTEAKPATKGRKSQKRRKKSKGEDEEELEDDIEEEQRKPIKKTTKKRKTRKSNYKINENDDGDSDVESDSEEYQP